MWLSNFIALIAVCLAVNSRGAIGSLDSEEHQQCPACANSACRTINGIYTRPDLPPGYSLVAQIPAGACRVLVQQLKHTRNFLALKNTNGSYIVNGEWKFSNSRVFQGAGTKFVYVHQDESSLETLSSPGPLANSIDIMIVNYQANPGIKYGYSLPVETTPVLAPPLIKRPNLDPSVLETRRLDAAFNTSLNQKDEARPPVLYPAHRRNRTKRKHFHWKITGLTACSKSCGGGTQTYMRVCTREITPHNQIPVHDRRCAHLDSSAPTTIRCNTDPCPPAWEPHWTECSATCGEGIQEYDPQCKQEHTSGVAFVNEVLCTLPKPTGQSRLCRGTLCESEKDNELVQDTEEDEWSVRDWSQCSVTCGMGHRTRIVTCPSGRCDPTNRPAHAEYCTMEPCEASHPGLISQHSSTNEPHSSLWLLTDWSQCSEACGTGTQTRFVVCGVQEQESCPDESKPELSRGCSSDKQCGGEWFVGPWGACSDSCGGRAKQKRDVFCVVKIRGQSHITNEMTCTAHLKPPNEQHCDGVCPPHWYFGDWGQCEGGCPLGVQRRDVRCLDIHGRQGSGCLEGDMPVAKRTCPCQSQAESRDRYQPAQDEPADRTCVDRIGLRKCKLAVQARLCHYPYYVAHCCESCRRAPETLE